MNQSPHSHKLVVDREYGRSGRYLVSYGDTTVSLLPFLPHHWRIQARLKKAAQKAIRRHDTGSVDNPVLRRDGLAVELNRSVLGLEVRVDDAYYSAESRQVAADPLSAEWASERIRAS